MGVSVRTTVWIGKKMTFDDLVETHEIPISCGCSSDSTKPFCSDCGQDLTQTKAVYTNRHPSLIDLYEGEGPAFMVDCSGSVSRFGDDYVVGVKLADMDPEYRGALESIGYTALSMMRSEAHKVLDGAGIAYDEDSVKLHIETSYS